MTTTNPVVSVVQPTLLSKMNERQVLQAIQAQGAMSRAEVARFAGISAPTASKAVESLLRSGFLEERDADELMRGRPAKRLCLPSRATQVVGLVIDADNCRLICAGLDGTLHESEAREFPTPSSYETLIDAIVKHVSQLTARTGIATLGLGISMPGLIDYRQQSGLLSPNVPITNHHSPARDLSDRLGMDCVMIQESRALCLAERRYGNARGLTDFAMLDINIGVGLGVVSGGQILTGIRGLAGEIGHITVEPEGRQCGCGNFGCLETVASDSALAHEVSQLVGRRVGIDEVIELVQADAIQPTEALEKVCGYLAVGVAAVINLFNPTTLFIHGRMFEADPALFTRMRELAGRRALPPSFADCEIVQARGGKRQGAVAGIIEHLMDSIVPGSSVSRQAVGRVAARA